MEDIAGLQMRARTRSTETKSTAAERVPSTKANVDFDVLFEKYQKEQQAFDDLLNQVDIARYKLSLADSFWTGKNDAMKHLTSYMTRAQKGRTQADMFRAVMQLHARSGGVLALYEKLQHINATKK